MLYTEKNIKLGQQFTRAITDDLQKNNRGMFRLNAHAIYQMVCLLPDKAMLTADQATVITTWAAIKFTGNNTTFSLQNKVTVYDVLAGGDRLIDYHPQPQPHKTLPDFEGSKVLQQFVGLFYNSRVSWESQLLGMGFTLPDYPITIDQGYMNPAIHAIQKEVIDNMVDAAYDGNAAGWYELSQLCLSPAYRLKEAEYLASHAEALAADCADPILKAQIMDVWEGLAL